MMRARLLLYRLSSTLLGQAILSALSFGVSVPFLRQKTAGTGKAREPARKRPFLVLITVDTEAGYVSKDERRVWQKEAPEAFQGYHAASGTCAAFLASMGSGQHSSSPRIASPAPGENTRGS